MPGDQALEGQALALGLACLRGGMVLDNLGKGGFGGLIAGLLALVGSLFSPVMAETTYQSPKSFIYEAFNGAPPKPEFVRVTPKMQPVIDRIITHNRFRNIRVRYWREGVRTAWLFDEIGRSFPITLGLVINQGQIEQVKVLIYRESHGWEVQQRFFTEQFVGASLKDNYRLSRRVENISGATLSVNAMRNTARLALYFDGLAAIVRERDVLSASGQGNR